jgi:hypothetical protein
MLPQKTVHEWLGCHKDRTAKTFATEDQLQVSQQTLHCSCNQPEFQSPFVISAVFIARTHRIFVSIANDNSHQATHGTAPLTALLRGPPTTFYVL